MDSFNLITAATPGGVGHRSLTQAVIIYTEYWYALIVLLTFLSVASAHTVLIARRASKSAPRGPDGRPLPLVKRKRSQEDEAQLLRFGPAVGRTAKIVFCCMSAIIVLTFAINFVALVLHAFVYEDPMKWASDKYWWWCGESEVVYFASALFLNIYFFLTLFEWKESPTVAHFVAGIFSLVGELSILLGTFFRAVNCQHVDPNRPNRRCVSSWEMLNLVVYTVRACVVLVSCALFVGLWCSSRSTVAVAAKEEALGQSFLESETTPLLNDSQRSCESPRVKNRRTSTNSRPDGGDDPVESVCPCKEENIGFYRSKKVAKKSTWEYLRGFSIFFPYLWPKDSIKLQMIVTLSFVLLVIQRIVNIMVPMQVGVVIQMLLLDGPSSFNVRQLVFLGILWGLQGSGGLLVSLRSLLWIRVSQYSFRALAIAAFEHVHSLSLDFHLGKRTGEVLSALNKGSAINQFLEQFIFNVFPILVDLLVAIYFFWTNFGALFAVLIGINTFWYMYLTIRMAQTRAEQRRDMSNADREEQAVKNDSINGYETVKYFNAEDFEFNRYRDAINVFQKAEAEVSRGNDRMVIIQGIVYNSGRLLAALLGAWQVSHGMMGVGEFSTLLAYLAQLQSPLNVFGTFYRQVQQGMIHGERLLELFRIKPTVVDGPNVRDLKNCKGHIRWSNVSFAYDKRLPALSDVNFVCKPGTMTAFVGESGGGKSTIFKLLYRYYNSSAGKIEVDGTDVKELSIDSVRHCIGVVPQETTLFNDTLMFNLKYANRDASDEEVFEACRAASIHDRILTFPDGYETLVGERGLKLSGGEKQRVAIARTILKNPKIIMLDEATSALDTNTEQEIQDRLGSLGEGRTLLVIAHRLSTITHADHIMVMHGGTIAEQGTHEQLRAIKGRYAAMWAKQIRAERAAEEARVASRKAHKLMLQAHIGRQPVCAKSGSSIGGKEMTCQGADVPSSSSSSDVECGGKQDEGQHD